MVSKFDPEDLQKVRDIPIESVVSDYVSLQRKGSSLLGLCPFHDEKTASFSVTPVRNMWHCFGCSQGGDTIDFVQLIEGLTFPEAVEFLAARAGITMHYVEGAAITKERVEPGTRQRLLECNRVAQDFFVSQLVSPEAQRARDFVEGRAFTSQDAAHFGMGYAPPGWNNLTDYLRSKGFTDQEIVTVGLGKPGQRGIYDVFRDRVMWPIKDVTGAVLGFGGRRLDDSDPQVPKYINTPESPIYHKSSVLYGLDLARPNIGKERRCVIVEGYTDVMAAHLSGITTAVATCGTAFTDEHAKQIRRFIGTSADSASSLKLPGGLPPRGGEVIFTFDGDAAGQAAALKAFRTDQDFASQAFVAVADDGLDPCDLRMQRGPGAVRDLIEGRKPLFDFVLKTIISKYDLDSPAARIEAMRATAPVLAEIRDKALRTEYVKQVSGWLGVNVRDTWYTVNEVWRRIRSQQRASSANSSQPGGLGGPGNAAGGSEKSANLGNLTGSDASSSPQVIPQTRLDPAVNTDPVWRVERDVLIAALQFPGFAAQTAFDTLDPQSFTQPTLRAIFEVIAAVGGAGEYRRLAEVAQAAGEPHPGNVALNRWAAAVKAQAGSVLVGALTNLATRPAPLYEANQSAEETRIAAESWVQNAVESMERKGLNAQIASLKAQLRRLDSNSPEKAEVFGKLINLENRMRELNPEF
ncbi:MULTISPECIES: DNA primase [Mobiluncus]|uniref:DNA primase n=2 Tax=Mobiluncus TaxID=2050 RepID=E6M182_9ACTO|nr:MULTISPECIES: DNA primase [Mobiluncus]EFU82901.1 DNA primase [Mobiluncus holmesii ATCC 35242]NMW44250.1 DNA primase [Mobiluncus curtisii]NMW83077.1 DNA primase [Mobiluncus curtisii]NMW98673.1 DNA primase [Mobiluncus curtisii]NMX05976.1 DNA primase [Mobiluncus curtisii]